MCKELFPRNTLVTRYLTWMLAMPPVCQNVWHVPYSVSCETGIFLDYKLGEVSFYNLNNRSYLFRFTHMFTENLGLISLLDLLQDLLLPVPSDMNDELLGG